MIKVLVIVDHATGISGPHRNVVGSLNALSARSDIDLRLLTGKIDENEPFASHCDIQLGFEPHNLSKILHNLRLLQKATRDRDLIYVPTGLKAFLYAYMMKGNRKLVGGPNITGIPLLMDPANPSPLMTMRMCDGWIEMSEIRARLCIQAGTPRDHINIVPHSIDVNRFSPSYRCSEIWPKYGIDPSAIKLIYVGNMHKELKGIAQLIHTFELLKNSIRGQKIQLILIGEIGPMFTDSHRLVSDVFPIGSHYGKELVELLASADIFMAASRWETFWYTPLEAMACGLPIVVSTAGAVPTMIPQDGVQGRAISIVDENYKYYPDASERLAAAVLPLLQDENLRVKMGHTARDYVIENFSETSQGNLLYQTFSSVLN